MAMNASLLLSIAVFLVCVTLGKAACPLGWRGRGVKCYLFVANDLASWGEAQSICRSHHGQLAELNVHARWVSNVAMSIRRDSWWIGMTDMEVEGRWVWVNSRRPVNNLHWHFGEPNGGYTSNCGDINASGNYNDDRCEHPMRFICEMM